MPKVNMTLLEQLLEQEEKKRGVSRDQLLRDIKLYHEPLGRMRAGKPVQYRVLKNLAKHLKLRSHEQLIAPDDQPNSGANSSGKWDEKWDNLLGDWKGDIVQESGPDGEPYSGKVELNLERDGTKIVGCYWFTFEDKTYECSATVTPLGEGYYRLEAVSEDDELEEDGLMVNTVYFKLKRSRNRIEGRYVGLGPHSDRIVYGQASGRKVAGAEGARRDVTRRRGAGGAPMAE